MTGSIGIAVHFVNELNLNELPCKNVTGEMDKIIDRQIQFPCISPDWSQYFIRHQKTLVLL